MTDPRKWTAEEIAAGLAFEKREVDAIIDELTVPVSEILRGHHPGLQGAALGDLVAMWIAGHRPDQRDQQLAMFTEMVKALIPMHHERVGWDEILRQEKRRKP